MLNLAQVQRQYSVQVPSIIIQYFFSSISISIGGAQYPVSVKYSTVCTFQFRQARLLNFAGAHFCLFSVFGFWVLGFVDSQRKQATVAREVNFGDLVASVMWSEPPAIETTTRMGIPVRNYVVHA